MSTVFPEATLDINDHLPLPPEENDGDGMVRCGETYGPAMPTRMEDVDVDPAILADLALKLAYTVPNFTTDWAVQRLCLSLAITAELLEQLRTERLIEVLGELGPLRHRFAITGRGRERASHLMEICGYVGPAPVALEPYNALLDWQLTRFPEPTSDDVDAAIEDFVFPEHAVEVAGLAVSSGRSLFIHGPPGNGKSSLGHMLRRALGGVLWIPHCVSVDHSIIRFFDPQCHHRVKLDLPPDQRKRIDPRWICVERPFVVVGGELTIDDLELRYSPTLGYYEAPVHLKANGGTFLLDDLGCQRVDSQELLKRWIIPLEHDVDYMTLQTGQKLQVPFRQLLVISTNLDPDLVMEPAILRRMGYRLHLNYPSVEQYAAIFRGYADRRDLAMPDGLLEMLMQRYQREERPLRCCDPRDLIERVRDICRFHRRKALLSDELVNLAWKGYFGESAEVPLDAPDAGEFGSPES